MSVQRRDRIDSPSSRSSSPFRQREIRSERFAHTLLLPRRSPRPSLQSSCPPLGVRRGNELIWLSANRDAAMDIDVSA